MRILLIILNLFVVNYASSQIDSLADIFINPKPIWSHVAIDSSSIGYKGRTGMDYFLTIAERKLLVNDSSLFIVYNNHFENLSGAFVEKLNLKDGIAIWKNSFDLRHSTKREYTNRLFINSKNELELLNFRYSFDTVDIFFPLWDNGKLSVRKYDLNSGHEIYKYHSPINDMDYPTFKASGNVFSYLNKNSIGGYDCYTNYIDKSIPRFSIAKTQLDSLGKSIKVNAFYDIIGKYKYINPYEDIPYLLNDNFDTIVRLIHTYSKKPFITGDTMELSLYFLNSDLTLQISPDIANSIAKLKEYQIMSLNNNYVGILGTEYFQDSTYPRQHILVVNPDGKLVEEIVYPQRTNSNFGTCYGMIKLRNEPGVLILNRNAKKLDSMNLLFYRSDGKGNLTMVSELRMKDNYNLAIGGYLYELNDGKILFGGLFRQLNLNVSQFPKTEKFVTSLWDFNITSADYTVGRESNKYKIYPNPANEYIIIDGGLDISFEYEISLINQFGKVILSKEVSNSSNVQISLTGLNDSIYFICIKNNINQLVYIGRILKFKK